MRYSISLIALGGVLLSMPICAAQDLETAISEISSKLAEDLATGEFAKLAVVEFSNLNGYESTLDTFIAEELVTQLFVARPGAFDIVERNQLAKVLEEQKLSASSLFDAESIARVGKILGIQAIVTGTIADLGDTIKINARVISVATAKIFSATAAKCSKSGFADTLLRQSSAPSPGEVGRVTASVQMSDVFFQNKFVRLTVKSLSLTETKKRATLALQLENLVAEDLYLAMDCPVLGCRPASLVTDGSSILKVNCNEVSGLVCVRSWDQDSVANQYTLVSGKSRTTVVFNFESGGSNEILGSHYSLGLDLLLFDSGKWQRFSAGISNIVLN